MDIARRLLYPCRQFFQRGSFVSTVAILLSGSGAYGLATIAAYPILTRLFSPEDYGVMGVFISAHGILSALVTLGYHVAIPVAQDPSEALSTLATAVGSSFLVSLASLLFIVISDHLPLANWLAAQLGPAAWVLPLSVLAAGLHRSFEFWFVREGSFSRVAWAKALQGASLTCCQITCGLLAMGALGLAAGDACGRIVAMVVLGAPLIWGKYSLPRMPSWRDVKTAAIRYRSFPLTGVWSEVANALTHQVILLFFSALYGLDECGLLYLSLAIVYLPMLILSPAVASVFVADFTRFVRTDPPLAHELLLITTKRMAILSLVMVIPIALFGPQLLAFALGAQWIKAGEYARLLTFPAICLTVSSTILPTLNLLERQGWQLALTSVRLLTLVGGVACAYALALPPWGAVLAYGLAVSGSSLLHVYLCHLALKKI